MLSVLLLTVQAIPGFFEGVQKGRIESVVSPGEYVLSYTTPGPDGKGVSRRRTVRPWGISCPTKGQPGYEQALKWCKKKFTGRSNLDGWVMGGPHNTFYTALMIVDKPRSYDLNSALLQNGYARANMKNVPEGLKTYAGYDELEMGVAAMEQNAQRSKLGLWGKVWPIPKHKKPPHKK